MRILNTKEAEKKYGRFSLPGFRSGSVIKRIIACLYYFFVLVFAVNSIRLTTSGTFGNSTDVFLALVVEFIIILILLVPVIAIGFSDYYDWHGIKLFLIIMVSWCVLFTAAQYLSTMFSQEFINSTNGVIETKEQTSGGATSDAEPGIEIDGDIIIDNMDELGETPSSAQSEEE